MDKEIFSKLFISYTRPNLEYDSHVWSPHLKKHRVKGGGPEDGNKDVTQIKKDELLGKIRGFKFSHLGKKKSEG